MMYSRPDLLYKILDTNAQAVTAYLNAQIDAGAQAVQIFDTWGGVLSDAAFKEFSLKYIRQIVAGLKRESEGRRVPVIVFAKGGGLWLESMGPNRRRRIGLGLDVQHRRSTPPRRQPSRPARQLRPVRPLRYARIHPHRGRTYPDRLRTRQQPCLQPRTRHQPTRRPRTRQNLSRHRTRAVAAVSRRVSHRKPPDMPSEESEVFRRHMLHFALWYTKPLCGSLILGNQKSFPCQPLSLFPTT